MKPFGGEILGIFHAWNRSSYSVASRKPVVLVFCSGSVHISEIRNPKILLLSVIGNKICTDLFVVALIIDHMLACTDVSFVKPIASFATTAFGIWKMGMSIS